jgi:hypothetical protein
MSHDHDPSVRFADTSPAKLGRNCLGWYFSYRVGFNLPSVSTLALLHPRLSFPGTALLP